MLIRGVVGSLLLLAGGVLAWVVYTGVPLAGVPFAYALEQCLLHSRVEVEFLYGLLYLLPLLCVLLTVAAFTIYSNGMRVLLHRSESAGVVRSMVVLHGLMAFFWLGLALTLPGTLESWALRLDGALPFPGCNPIYEALGAAPAVADDAPLPSAQIASTLQLVATWLAPVALLLAAFDGLVGVGLQTLLSPSPERLQRIFPADDTTCTLCGVVPLTAATAGIGCSLCHGRVQITTKSSAGTGFDAVIQMSAGGNLPLNAPVIRFDLPRRGQITHLESRNNHAWQATDTPHEWRSSQPVQTDTLGINFRDGKKAYPLRVSVRPEGSPSWSQWITLQDETS